jgi:uncharacterized protein
MNKKIIAFDIPHLADFNLLKNAIIVLAKQNKYKVVVYTLDRGRLQVIVRNELPAEVEVINLGKWKSNKFSKIVITNFYRTIQFCLKFIRNRPAIGISPGTLPFALALTLFRVKNIQFSDDVERWFLTSLEGFFATEKYYPAVSTKFSNRKVIKIAMLKQWAYLSPKYFTPEKSVLETYGLVEKKYFFVREIITGSTNYRTQPEYLVSKIAALFPAGYKVVLSLEDKSAVNNYPKNWIILKEPVAHFHSLIYYSKALISSGDSMAREGGVLGVPSIYCGIRYMEANKILEQQGMLLHVPYADVPDLLTKIVCNEKTFEDQEPYRQRLSSEFIELTDFIVTKAEAIVDNRPD